MIDLRFSEGREKGTYKPCRTEFGRLTANIFCPGCGVMLHLDPHKVNKNGNVEPSVVCCNCDFHDYVVLNNWKIPK